VRRAAAALLAALAVAGCGADGDDEPGAARPRAVRDRQGRGVGDGLRPAGRVAGRVGVLFLHGWGATLPSAYQPWIDHLVARGHVVIYPRYQDSALDPPPDALPNAVLGIRSALTRTPGLRSLVAVGHSAGGALAADLTAIAPTVGLERPRAVLSLYAGRALARFPDARIPEQDLDEIPPTTRVEVYAGDDDRVVGAGFARRIARRTGGRFVLVTDSAVDDHLAPQRADAASRRTFWAALDRLIAGAR
jgi:acetyl esterase/lipase